MTDFEPSNGAVASGTPRREPVRRRGEPFFDQLVHDLYSPALVRRTLHRLVQHQFIEAARIQSLRGWGGAQPQGNDRYQYSLEQGPTLSKALPGAELLRPSGSLLYKIAGAVIYPMHYGQSAHDCPTSAQFDDMSQIQRRLAAGNLDHQPTLFDLDPSTPPTVVWLLFSGNYVESGPLASYLAVPGGQLPERRIDWLRIEPLLTDAGPDGPGDLGPDGANDPLTPIGPVPPEPDLALYLRR